MKYTGIGSRETPEHILILMTELAKAFSEIKFTLRSGGAEGADSAFEKGALLKEIYIPWDGFNSRYTREGYIIPPYNEEFIYDYHPNAEYLRSGALKLMSRNTYQVLGLGLDDPSELLICWTSDGKASGGTGQAMRIAKDYKVPIYNLYNEEDILKLTRDFKIELANS